MTSQAAWKEDGHICQYVCVELIQSYCFLKFLVLMGRARTSNYKRLFVFHDYRCGEKTPRDTRTNSYLGGWIMYIKRSLF